MEGISKLNKKNSSLWDYMGGSPILVDIITSTSQVATEQKEDELKYGNPNIKNQVFHYWDYISNNLSHLDTVKFI